ncbi:DUF317 domain-containing protein [Streptomyces iconiensis]|uniref:DUF317 domain-containing protein n=1 Tax=Streptomyces iconiensis TaxID=1384038 RepID=UPI003D2F5BDA
MERPLRPRLPHVLLQSPDQQVQLALEPNEPEPRDSWWRITSPGRHDRRWQASFGANTPVEFVGAFTDNLTGPAVQRSGRT